MRIERLYQKPNKCANWIRAGHVNKTASANRGAYGTSTTTSTPIRAVNTNAKFEHNFATINPGETVQFERTGFYAIDAD